MRAARRFCWAAILAHSRAWLVVPRPDLATLGRLLGLMQRTRSRVEGDKGTECGAPAVKVLTSYFGRCNDRVAPGRYLPGAPTDPYVLALEHTVPQTGVRCVSIKRMHRAYGGQWVTLDEAPEFDPRHRAKTVPAIQPLGPSSQDFVEKP